MNEENLLLYSRDKSHKNGLSGDSSSDASDIWDDTLLVEAYDKAVNIAKTNCLKKQSTAQEQGKQSKRKESDNQKWKVGDKCRCQYSEDLHYYEADIIGITESSGTCIVEYVGYKNKEKVFLKNLKPSKGEDARLQQIEDAENDVGNNLPKNYKKGDFNSHASWNLSRKLESNLRKPAFNKKKGHLKDKNDLQSDTNESVNFSAGLGLGSIVPPPPPPEIFRTLCEDDTETEAMSAMLISWYMSGYHTGYYQGLKMAKKQS